MRYCKLLMVGTLGDPLADIDATINKVKWAMKGGAVVINKLATPAGVR